MSTQENPCDFNPLDYPLDEAYQKTKECLKYTYHMLIAKATLEPARRLAKALASRIVEKPFFNVIEGPRHIGFSSLLDQPRLSPLPITGITAPRTAEGNDLPIQYNEVPTPVFEPRELAENYVDSLKVAIESLKHQVALLYIAQPGAQPEIRRYKLEQAFAVGLQFEYGSPPWTYDMSYDRDYPPAEPLTLYVEGDAFSIYEPDMYNVVIVNANNIAYLTETGEFYAGMSGLFIMIVDEYQSLCGIRYGGKYYDLKYYDAFMIAISGAFMARAYVMRDTPKPYCP